MAQGREPAGARPRKAGPVNRLLGAAPRRGSPLARENVTLRIGQVLHEAGERVRDVYFPDGAVVSLIVERSGDAPVEVAMVGHEGLVGLSLALGAAAPWARAQVQGSGAAIRVRAAPFLAEMRRNATLRRNVHRYGHVLLAHAMQTTACNRNHTAEQRLARWLLMMRDRTRRDRLELTQAFLGAMVGMRRAGVNEVAAGLQARALIRWRRGAIEILDRAGLEAAACGCYRLLKGMESVSAGQPAKSSRAPPDRGANAI